jgi:hypothetical protein
VTRAKLWRDSADYFGDYLTNTPYQDYFLDGSCIGCVNFNQLLRYLGHGTMNRVAKVIVLGLSLALATSPAWADYWGDQLHSDKDNHYRSYGDDPWGKGDYFSDKDDHHHHDRDDHHYHTVPGPDIGGGIPTLAIIIGASLIAGAADFRKRLCK